LEPAEGYSLTHAQSAIEDADRVSGDHRPEGVIVAAGPKVTAFEQQPLLIDLGADHPGRARRAGLDPAPGRVLHEVVGAEASLRGGEAAPTTGGREDEPSVTDTEADEMEAPPRPRLPRVARCPAPPTSQEFTVR